MCANNGAAARKESHLEQEVLEKALRAQAEEVLIPMEVAEAVQGGIPAEMKEPVRSMPLSNVRRTARFRPYRK